MADDDALAKYDSLCREVYADTRVPPGTQEVILAMGWAMFRHPDRLNGSALWTEVRRMLRRDEIGVLWMPEEADRCSVRERDANNRLVPCREKAVIEETLETTACMDRGERHFSTLRYCRGHQHMAAHAEDTP